MKEKVEKHIRNNAASPEQALERITRRESYDNATIERFKEQFGGPEHYREIALNIDVTDEVFRHYYASDLIYHTIIALQDQTSDKTTDQATAQDPKQTLQDIIDQLDEYEAGFDFPATEVVKELSSSLPIELTDHTAQHLC